MTMLGAQEGRNTDWQESSAAEVDLLLYSVAIDSASVRYCSVTVLQLLLIMIIIIFFLNEAGAAIESIKFPWKDFEIPSSEGQLDRF